jgi:hypothetical protein
MAANAMPAGKLTAGGIGGFLLAGAMVLLFVAGAAGAGGGGAGAVGGLGLIAFILIIGGGICHALGYFGLGGGLPGAFAIVFGIAPLVAFLLPILTRSMEMALIGQVVLYGSGGLTGIFGGIKLMGLENGGGLGKAAGIVSIIGGAAFAFFGVMLFIPSLLVSLGGIIGLVGLFGSAAGFALAGVTMLGQRNAG